MDELAHTTRTSIRSSSGSGTNPTSHPERGVPYSANAGWSSACARARGGSAGSGARRHPRACATVAGWIGYGMAVAIRGHFQADTSVRVLLDPRRAVVVQSDMTDIGTGTYTILAQVAARRSACRIDACASSSGDSEFPSSAGRVGRGARRTRAPPRTARAARTRQAARGSDRRRALAAARPRSERRDVSRGQRRDRHCVRSADGDRAARTSRPASTRSAMSGLWTEPNFKAYSMNTYGAHFAEVRVDADTGEIRLRRMLGVFDGGRISTPRRRARS